jgi:hypothetical protein
MVKSLTLLWQDWQPLFLGAAMGLPIAAFFVIMGLDIEPTAKERQACDQAVATVLTTKDPVELERAMFLVKELKGCRIGNRL